MKQEDSIRLFKCLSDKSRLQIVTMLMSEDLYTEIIAERLDLSASTVSFHMKKLEEAHLVSSKKDQYYTVYTLNKKMFSRRLADIVGENRDEAEIQKERDRQYRDKVIETFFEYGKLKQFPSQRKKRIICCEKMIESLEFDKIYEEKELNEILKNFNEDYCAARRYMLEDHLLSRDGSKYMRLRQVEENNNQN